MSDTIARLKGALPDRYAIERELGEGGMATVYLARDRKHNRPVAIKVLEPALAAVLGPERFLHEIETTAGLQHRNILPLFDSGQAGSFLYYVMPYVEGETLREKLEREKQLGVEEAVEIATEVAGALDHAHRQNVIHRDIKPENILLRDGQPVVADFGIALALSPEESGRLTRTGHSLGTPRYMSPEQAMGDRDVDARTDIYSLACVLYEMLAGHPPFEGSSAQAVLSQLLSAEPAPLTAERSTVPVHVDLAVRKAMAKVPADRYRTAGEFARALTDPALAPAAPPTADAGDSARRWKAMGLALAGGAAIALLVSTGLRRDSGGPAVYDVGLPDSVPMAFKAYWLPAFSVAPDGSFAVYVGELPATTQLWLRSLVDDEVRPIRGTEGGTAPIVSPDGRRVAFRAAGQLKAVPIEGGPATVLADVTDPAGLVWLPDGSILVADHDGNLLRWLDPATGELGAHPARHCVLARPLTPDDRTRVLCGGGATQFGEVMDLDDATREAFRQRGADPGVPGAVLTGSDFRPVDGRHLTYVSQAAELRIFSFDREKLTAGRPVTTVSGVRREGLYGAGQYHVTRTGMLVYAPGGNAEIGRLVKVGPDGGSEPLPMAPAAFLRFDLSPDGRTLAAVVSAVGEHELRIYDLATGQYAVWQRALYIGEPEWEPSGDRLVVLVVPFEGPTVTIVGSPTAASPPDTLPGVWGNPAGHTTDGRLVVWAFDARQALAIDLAASPPAVDTLASSVYFPSLSPDGRWLAYQNRATGQLLVEPQPSRDRRYQVADEAWEPRWLSSTELVYWIESTWYRVTIGASADRPVAEPRAWFSDLRFADTQGESYLVTPDGGMIYVQGPERTTASYLRVVPDWLDDARRAVAEAR